MDWQTCPCGYLGHGQKSCRCLASAIDRYRGRLSGPLLDRVDALIEVPPLTLLSLENGKAGESSAVVGERVAAARLFREDRLLKSPSAGRARPLLPDGEHGDSYESTASYLEAGHRLSGQARSLLRQALVREGLSGRGYARIVSLARTIADLDQKDDVDADHVAEALALRLDYRRVGLE